MKKFKLSLSKQLNLETVLGGSEVSSVNSRDVYKYLGVEAQYANWIQRAIEKYDFTEGEDFNIFVNNSKGGRPTKDYIVTLDMAKELCMVSNTPKGKETRKWFIAQEKKANAPKTNKEILLMALAAEEEKERLMLENKQCFIDGEVMI